MKKINFLAIAAIALTSVFSFTSCDKNDDAFNPALNNQAMTPVQNTPEQNTPAQDAKDQAEETSESENDHILNTGTALNKLKNFDFIGTWEYTSEDGKTYVLDVTGETSSNSSVRRFEATLTIDGEVYDGTMSTGMFKTNAKATNSTLSLCGLGFLEYADKTAGDELVARITYDRNVSSQPAVFKKVNGTQTRARRGPHFPPY